MTAGLSVVFLIVAAILLEMFWPTQYRVFRYNFSDIDDYKLFESRALPPTQNVILLVDAVAERRTAAARLIESDESAIPLDDSDTVAFLVLKDGEVLYEKYWNGYGPEQPVMVYSVTKSIMSLLVGLAIEDGLIGSVDQHVSEYLPWFDKPGLSEIRIGHLLQMTSGLPYSESALNNPFGLHAHLTYTDDIPELLTGISTGVLPGEKFSYKSVDYALLGMVLDKALGGESITDYLARKLWIPLGAEHDGLWSLDSEQSGLEKTWCCLSMTARDLSRFGLLMQGKGTWRGEQLLPLHWIEISLVGTSEKGGYPYYRYGWWLMRGNTSAFRGEGILGQFLYIDPDTSVVIVRFGSGLGGHGWETWLEYLDNTARMIGEIESVKKVH